MKKENEKEEFPSYGKALAAITQKWDNNNPAPPQIQAASLMYDYLLEWYGNIIKGNK